MSMFGTLLPWIGWRELEPHKVEALADVTGWVESGKRYKGFAIEWLGYGFVCDIEEIESDDERHV